jgi:hypothetical protein
MKHMSDQNTAISYHKVEFLAQDNFFPPKNFLLARGFEPLTFGTSSERATNSATRLPGRLALECSML